MNKMSIIELLKKEKKIRKEKSEIKKHVIGNIVEIGTSFLKENPYQPRVKYDKIEELAQSMKKNGQIQAITITPIKGDNKNYYIVAGHRRTMAAKKAGLMVLKAVVVDFMSDDELKRIAMAENLHRSQLKPAEIAIFIKELQRDVPKIKNIEISNILGISQSAVSHYLKMSSLKIEILKELESIGIKRDVLVFLSKIKDKEVLNKALDLIRKNPKIKVNELSIETKQEKKKNFEIKCMPTYINIHFGTTLKKNEQKIMEDKIMEALKKASIQIKKENCEE